MSSRWRRNAWHRARIEVAFSHVEAVFHIEQFGLMGCLTVLLSNIETSGQGLTYGVVFCKHLRGGESECGLEMHLVETSSNSPVEPGGRVAPPVTFRK
jgi:hypothetical protein